MLCYYNLLQLAINNILNFNGLSCKHALRTFPVWVDKLKLPVRNRNIFRTTGTSESEILASDMRITYANYAYERANEMKCTVNGGFGLSEFELSSRIE